MCRTAIPLSLALLALPFQILAQGLPRTDPADVGMSAQRLERLTETLDGFVERGLLPGGVALVARHGRVAYVHAFGQRDREARAARAPRTDRACRPRASTWTDPGPASPGGPAC